MKYAIAFFLHVGAALVLSAGGIAVEFANCANDDTVRIAAGEFARYQKIVTGREAKGGRRILLKVDSSISCDGKDAYTIVSDGKAPC